MILINYFFEIRFITASKANEKRLTKLSPAPLDIFHPYFHVYKYSLILLGRKNNGNSSTFLIKVQPNSYVANVQDGNTS